MYRKKNGKTLYSMMKNSFINIFIQIPFSFALRNILLLIWPQFDAPKSDEHILEFQYFNLATSFTDTVLTAG